MLAIDLGCMSAVRLAIMGRSNDIGLREHDEDNSLFDNRTRHGARRDR